MATCSVCGAAGARRVPVGSLDDLDAPERSWAECPDCRSAHALFPDPTTTDVDGVPSTMEVPR